MIKFEPVSQEALKFNQELNEVLIAKVIGNTKFAISDESRISDFLSFIDCKGKQLASGDWEFTWTYYDLKAIKQDLNVNTIVAVPKSQREQYKRPRIILMKDSKVIKEAQLKKEIESFFKVSIPSNFIRLNLPELALHISQQLTPETRALVTKTHQDLFN